MPKVYQASYKENGKNWKTNNASQTLILVEARDAAKEYGVRVVVEELEIEKPSFKYFVECMNGRKPNSRKFVCAFEPRESVMVEGKDGEFVRRWKVKKV
tara:strand:- start:289 stop:585 length:297 start_codon:yes stop_codon:yes gene_type:complete